MALKVNSVHIEDLFEPKGDSDKTETVGYKVNDTDISNYYAAASLDTDKLHK